jgi:hypothetical protein
MNSTNRFLILGAMVAAALALASCGSDDDNPIDGGSVDTTPPTVSTVAAVDQYHIDVTFDENVQRSTAEDPSNYIILEAAAPLAELATDPGDSVRVLSGSLASNQRKVTLTLLDALSTANYQISVHAVRDAAGNAIQTAVNRTFAGTNEADTTPAELVARSPAPGATGVPVGQWVSFQFSEPVIVSTVTGGVTWEKTTGGTPVSFSTEWIGPAEFALIPSVALDVSTQYTVTISGVEDLPGNVTPDETWNFTTAANVDNTPPTILTFTPVNGATNVNVNTNIVLTFSEPVNQFTLMPQITPSIDDGVATWTDGGKKLTFDPDEPLLTDQVYVFSFLPGTFEDLSGNSNSQALTITFSTGATLPSGGFSGTISGHPGTGAADPTGGVVAAATSNPFGDDDDFIVAGTTVVAANDSYNMRYLQDDVYYPIVVKDTNGDGRLDPSYGDAIGAYGIDFLNETGEIDSVTVAGSVVTGVNFPLFDTSAITGRVTYAGELGGNYPLFIGLFDPVGFDPTDPPLYGMEVSWPDFPFFGFNMFDDDLADGEYVVAAFIDANTNGVYDAAVDPAGALGSTVTVANGSDALDLVVVVADPPLTNAPAGPGVAWPNTKKRAAWLETLAEALRETTLQ